MLPLLDGQVHHDTHVIPMGNYVIGVGNYVIVSPSELGNYVSADSYALSPESAAPGARVNLGEVMADGIPVHACSQPRD
jgi:hypothetical protein